MLGMGAIDKEVRKYLSNASIFADAFNFKIYDGRQVIQPEALREMDTAEVVLPYGNDARTPVQRFRDVLKLYAAMQDDEAVYLVLGIEAQAAVHYAMPVRNMLYDAMNYAQQVARAAASHRQAETKLSGEEFLSGFRKEDRLMPVITLVVSFAADVWDGPMSIHEMLSVRNRELLAFVPDYRLNVLSPADIEEEDFDKFRTGLGAVMQFIKHRRDKALDWLSGNRRFEQVDWETASLIKTVTGADMRLEKKGEPVNMWEAWEYSMEQARQDGDKQGFDRGMEQGFDRGMVNVLRHMMRKKGLSLTEAMDMAGIAVLDRPRYEALLQ